ncbi:uncharacterized protein ACMZJ9_003903 [Mantella aurantiaca]
MRLTMENFVDSEENMHFSNEEKDADVDEEEADTILSGQPSHRQLTSSTSIRYKAKDAEKHTVSKSKKPLKKRDPDIQQASSEIMTMLGELREQLRKSRQRKELGKEDNITGFLRSLEYDIRQIPQQKISALKNDIMQVVQRYLP